MTEGPPAATCRRCGNDLRPDRPDGRDVCAGCARRPMQGALSNMVGWLTDEVVAAPGGHRMAVLLDGDRPVDWLCEHVHPTPEEAFECVKGEGGCTCVFHLSSEQVRRCIARRSRR